MTKTLGTNDDNDLYLGPDGNLVMLSGLPAVLAACATASKAQLGEMVLAQNAGIPNFQTIWVGAPNYAIWERYLRTALESVRSVREVKEITFTTDQGVLSYRATISTEFGEAQLNG